MTAVTLPPPSPALTVHEAAARIRRAAEAAQDEMATNGYWSSGWAAGVENAIGGEGGELAALFPPELALGLADWLDERASATARFGEPLPPLALVVAECTTP
ncbi:hypothetical protein SUDANB145_07275 (plasmid) [Streptomyces sp. enrichment culture]|uniref:hypothetical protein n=1 Tax=Streptomyces sp. enrichment culture TaxID=1795815 RepID=UPI003F56FB0F